MDPKILINQYQQNLIAFADILKSAVEMCIDEGITNLSAAIVDEFKNLINEGAFDIGKMIDLFLTQTYTLGGGNFAIWERISARDEKYFKENILSVVPEKYRVRFEPYLDLIDAVDGDDEPMFDEEFKNAIWEYIDSFVSLSIKYLYACRRQNSNKLAQIPSDRLSEMAKMFEVKI